MTGASALLKTGACRNDMPFFFCSTIRPSRCCFGYAKTPLFFSQQGFEPKIVWAKNGAYKLSNPQKTFTGLGFEGIPASQAHDLQTLNFELRFT
jgi:hypothetical protein